MNKFYFFWEIVYNLLYMTKFMQKNSTLIIILCLITSMTRFVIDSYLPSLPSMSLAFNGDAAGVQLTVTMYILGFGLSQFVYGPLSDRFGRKKILISGLLFFLIANTACIFTHSLPWLLALRCLSGLGMGVCGVLNRAIASDCFSGIEFSKAWSYTTTAVVLVLATAPLIGSVVQSLWDWQANFILSTAVVSIILFIIAWKLPETHYVNRLPKMCIKQIAQNYKTILKAPSFLMSTLSYMLTFSGLIVYFQLSPFIFIEKLKLTPLEYGYTTLVIAGSYLTGGLIVSRLARSAGVKLLWIVGITLNLLGGLSMLAWDEMINENLNVIGILAPTVLYVIGARIIIPNATANAFKEFRHLGGSTSGLIGGIQMVGTAAISFVMAHFAAVSADSVGALFTCLGVAGLLLFTILYLFDNGNAARRLFLRGGRLFLAPILNHPQVRSRLKHVRR